MHKPTNHFLLQLLVALAICIWPTSLWSQETQSAPPSSSDSAEKADSKPAEFAEIYDKQFNKREPHVGTVIDDLIAFDEKGNELNFDDLRGKYTVINFGCLT